MLNAHSKADFSRQTFVQWFSTCWLATVASLTGFCWTMTRPDSHPVVFAASVSWGVNLVVAAVMRDVLLRMDPRRFGYAVWEREGQVYRNAGVAAFRSLLRHTPLGWLNPLVRLAAGRPDLDHLAREMVYAEGTHWIAGALTLILAIGYFVCGHATIAGCFAVLALPLHAYPVMLQRWNRGRVLRAMRRRQARATASQAADQGAGNSK